MKTASVDEHIGNTARLRRVALLDKIQQRPWHTRPDPNVICITPFILSRDAKTKLSHKS